MCTKMVEKGVKIDIKVNLWEKPSWLVSISEIEFCMVSQGLHHWFCKGSNVFWVALTLYLYPCRRYRDRRGTIRCFYLHTVTPHSVWLLCFVLLVGSLC